MGVDISDLVVKHQTSLREHSGSTFSVDAYNILYQFLSSIRQPDGTPLMDSQGRVTSHLSGLFYRTINMLDSGIRPVYVFDGKPAVLKNRTIEERKLAKEKARIELAQAREEGDSARVRSLSSRINYVSGEIVSETMELLSLMGLPYVEAPSEGEAQASYMSKVGKVNGVISQDYDCLLFGAARILRNFAVFGRRKVPGRNIYVNVKPEYIELEETLKKNEVTLEQLIHIGILVGTDFNRGIKGIGPKTALKLIKKHGDIATVLKEKDQEIENLDRIIEIFMNPDVKTDFDLTFNKPDREGILRFLCEEHNFSEGRVTPYLDTLEKAFGKTSQANLDSFF